MRKIGMQVAMVAVLALAACGESATGGVAPEEGPRFSGSPAVQLSGPSSVQAYQPCEWYAFASGGTAPYTWSWSQTTGGPGYANPRTSTLESYVTSTSGTMTLSVTITDALGRTATASKYVTTSWQAPECYI